MISALGLDRLYLFRILCILLKFNLRYLISLFQVYNKNLRDSADFVCGPVPDILAAVILGEIYYTAIEKYGHNLKY